MNTTENKSVKIGIDVGGSTTKIVGFKDNTLISPQLVKADDPLTSAYGAFGKFLLDNGLTLEDISCVKMTGVGSSFIKQPIYNLDCRRVSEFSSIGLGGLYLSGLDDAIIVSMGTGTALIHAKRLENGETFTEYLGGTGVGGGTLVGLSKKLLGLDNIEHIMSACEGGDLSKVDLRICDISNQDSFTKLTKDLTAANFGRMSDIADKNDIAYAIVNMVSETIGMMSIFAARSFGLKNIVLSGNLSRLEPIKKVMAKMQECFGYNFIIPENSAFSTVIGAALCKEYE